MEPHLIPSPPVVLNVNLLKVKGTTFFFYFIAIVGLYLLETLGLHKPFNLSVALLPVGLHIAEIA